MSKIKYLEAMLFVSGLTYDVAQWNSRTSPMIDKSSNISISGSINYKRLGGRSCINHVQMCINVVQITAAHLIVSAAQTNQYLLHNLIIVNNHLVQEQWSLHMQAWKLQFANVNRFTSIYELTQGSTELLDDNWLPLSSFICFRIIQDLSYIFAHKSATWNGLSCSHTPSLQAQLYVHPWRYQCKSRLNPPLANINFALHTEWTGIFTKLTI